MLDRSLLLKELDRVAHELFIDDKPAYELAKKIWLAICADPLFAHKVAQANAPWPVPSWNGQLCHTVAITEQAGPYRLLSVDGSQIYPDRHHGVSCYLINIGGVSFAYGQENPVQFFTHPHIFTHSSYDDVQVSTDLVNCVRQELELRAGFDALDQHDLLLFDGSLIFWHLEAKDPLLKQMFLPKYLATLFALYKKQVLTASYISAPRSRELVNLIRLHLCDFDTSNVAPFKQVDRLVDATICRFFVPPYHRTTVFKNHAHVSDQYPDPVHPYFFYVNGGQEIGRVEIPAWIALDEVKTNQVASMVLDQARKGSGYPVALAEAHEQAVVKGPDRELFYHLLAKMGIERARTYSLSEKQTRKRSMGI